MTPITIETTLSAPIEKVWEYLTAPEHVQQWNHASDDWECPHAMNNLSVGGKFAYTMSAKNGSATFDFSGTYTSIIPHQLIEYSLDDGRKVRIEFSAGDDGTVHLIETFDPEQENSQELQRAGWQAILDNFKRYVH